MTIEITDEMREAFQRAAGWPGPPWRFGVDVANGLGAVLAIVERDWNMQPNPAPVEWRKSRRPAWTEGAPHLADCPCVHCSTSLVPLAAQSDTEAS